MPCVRNGLGFVLFEEKSHVDVFNRLDGLTGREHTELKLVYTSVVLQGLAGRLLGEWHFSPASLVIIFDIPPYALGHESIGIRFVGWRWLYNHMDYFYFPVGYLLYLVQ